MVHHILETGGFLLTGETRFILIFNEGTNRSFSYMDTNLTDARYMWTVRIEYPGLEHRMIVVLRNRLLTTLLWRFEAITVLFVHDDD